MDPVTVMTCIQVASSVAGMLSPKGPDIGDLINIQTQMIKNISNQVAKLQDGINQIIFDIDNLKTHITYEVPSIIYKEIVTNQLIAKFSGYERIINTYLEERETEGIFIAYEKNKDRLRDTLEKIQDKRDEVFQVKDFFIAPIVARCFKVEIDLLIILLGDKIGDISKAYFKNSLLQYEIWIEDMQNENNNYSVDYNIKSLKTNIIEELNNCVGFKICTDDNIVERSERHKTIFGHEDYIFITAKASYYSFIRLFSNQFEEKLKEIGSSNEEVMSMYNDLNIELIYMPNQASKSIDKFMKDENVELRYIEEYFEAIPMDGTKAHTEVYEISNDIYRIDKEYLLNNKCNNADQRVFTKLDYLKNEEKYYSLCNRILVPVSHKNILKDIKNKINFLKTQLS